MPRKTRILHGEDEYLFVEAPGDVAGPALLIFARSENRRAVAPGRTPTHQSEHGLWVQVARFDGSVLALAPEPPKGLGDRLKGILPKYVDVRRERTAQAKNAHWWLAVKGNALHALHLAQPGGILIRLWKTEAEAKAHLAALGEPGSAQSTGDLREFLELRAEEGFAGAQIQSGATPAVGADDPDVELVFFCLDEASRIQFMKVGRGAGEAASHLLDDAGRWRPYEGDGELDPFVDPDAWDRLLVRTYGRIPFLGYGPGWRCFVLMQQGKPFTTVDPEGDGRTQMVALFHDPAAADAWRSTQKAPRATIERVADLGALVREQSQLGVVARLQPGDHRVRSATLWPRSTSTGDDLLLDGFAGIWRSRDGDVFEPAE